MRALITGGAGFIGSHLVDLLLEQGHQVAAIDNLTTGRLENIQHHFRNPKFHFTRASIMDEVVMDRLASQSDTIFHLAAAVGVDLIVKNPVRTIETNVQGSEAVFKSAYRYDCKVLLASTSEVYGKGIKAPFNEDDDVVLGPTSKSRWAYAISKMLDESLGFAHHQEYGLKVVIMRLFNTVGPRQTGRYGMVIPRFMAQALANEPITIFGDGTQSRCFCDVQDVVRALMELGLRDEVVGRVVNIGSKEEISIESLAYMVREVAESSSEIVKIPYSEAYAPGFEDMLRRQPDIRRIRELIGWEPRTNLMQTLIRIRDYMLATSHS